MHCNQPSGRPNAFCGMFQCTRWQHFCSRDHHYSANWSIWKVCSMYTLHLFLINAALLRVRVSWRKTNKMLILAWRCEFSATDDGKVVAGCVGIPLFQPAPLISGNTLNPPPGTNSCVVSKGSVTATPTATCTPAAPLEPILPDDFTFEIPAGR